MFDTMDIGRLLWRRKLTVMFWSIVFCCVAIGIALIIPRSYVAEGQIVVRAESSAVSDPDHSFYSAVVHDSVITTERDVLAARGLMSRIAETVSFPTKEPTESWTTKFLAPAATFVEGHLPPAWAGRVASVVQPFLVPPPARDASAEKIDQIDRVGRSLSTAADRGSSVVSVRSVTTDPQLSAAIVNAGLKIYMEDRVAAQQVAAHNVETALRERLQQTKAEIASTEMRIGSLMMRPGVVESSNVPNASNELTLVGTRLSDAQANLAAKRAAFQSAQKLRDTSGGDPNRILAMLDTGAASTAELRKQLTDRQTEVSRAATQFGSSHPQYIAARNDLRSLMGQISGEAQRLLAQRQAEYAAAEQVVASVSAQYNEMRQGRATMSPQILSTDRERDTLSNLRKIAGNIEDRLIAVAALPVDPNARVLTWAQIPLRAAYPNKPLIAVAGLLTGLALSGITIVLREFRGRTYLTGPDQAGVVDARLLGSLPKVADASGYQALQVQFDGIAVELEDACAHSGYKVLALTSGRPGEGKTTVSANLALALARSGKRVLLINCDLHQSTLRLTHRSRRDPETGNSDPLAAVVQGPHQRLFILSGLDRLLPDPNSFLRSDRFAEIIRSARSQYDIVLCDTPPLLSVPDAILVGRRSDAVILVSEAGESASETVLAEISRRIEASGRPICGVIATKVTGNDSEYLSYEGYGKHRRSKSQVFAQFVANSSTNHVVNTPA